MLSFWVATVFLSLVPASYSCDDHVHERGHTHHRRGSRITPPSRPLEWGDVNIISTTDTHGWLLGHQKDSFPEPNYSGDFGDFFSFVNRMHQIAIERDVDLLVVDSGDLHDGTGLSDGYPLGSVDAHDLNKLFQQLPYDVLSVGNHELYNYVNTLDMYKNFIPRYNGRYLSSNVNITITNTRGENVSVPLGNRYAKFTTRKGRHVTALGVIFDFTGNDKGTSVQMVEDMVKEEWFRETIQEEPDFFLLVGHMPVSSDSLDKWPLVFNAIRSIHPHTPVLIFGGHTHIRYCSQLDGRSMSLMSGRYMETVGWMSVKLGGSDPTGDLEFSRRYLDTNLVTYEYHTNLSTQTFNTVQGASISRGLVDLFNNFELGYTFGTAPQDFYLLWSSYPSNTSLLSELVDKALPYSLSVNNTRADNPRIIIINSGSQRFDIYSGSFNRNDQWTVSDYASYFQYISDVPFSTAKKVLPALNSKTMTRRDFEALEVRGEVSHIYSEWLRRMNELDTLDEREISGKTWGYVTHDQCPGIGDDTPHKALITYDAPRYIGSPLPNVLDGTDVDLVFIDFIAPHIVTALNSVQGQRKYTPGDIKNYTTPILVNQIWGVYAEGNWNH